MKKYFILYQQLFIGKYNFILLFFLFLITACVSPDPLTDLNPEEKDLYVTNRDTSVDFSNYQTYIIVDSVRVVSKSLDSSEEKISSAPLILSTVESELQKKGFIETSDTTNADVGISVSVLRFTEEVPVSYFPYVGGAYFGYVSPAFYGFPGYSYGFPPYYGYYQIDVGSISIEMYDLKSARTSSGNQLNIIWNALLVGSLAGSSTEDDGGRIVKAISSAFDQSPYLKDGK